MNQNFVIELSGWRKESNPELLSNSMFLKTDFQRIVGAGLEPAPTSVVLYWNEDLTPLRHRRRRVKIENHKISQISTPPRVGWLHKFYLCISAVNEVLCG